MITTSVIISSIFKAAWHVQLQTYILQENLVENADYGKITCVSMVMYLLSAFLLIFSYFTLSLLKNSTECQLFKYDLKEQRNYSIMFMISLKHIYIQNLKSLEEM